MEWLQEKLSKVWTKVRDAVIYGVTVMGDFIDLCQDQPMIPATAIVVTYVFFPGAVWFVAQSIGALVMTAILLSALVNIVEWSGKKIAEWEVPLSD